VVHAKYILKKLITVNSLQFEKICYIGIKALWQLGLAYLVGPTSMVSHQERPKKISHHLQEMEKKKCPHCGSQKTQFLFQFQYQKIIQYIISRYKYFDCRKLFMYYKQ
jgi:hypothetical protein